MHIPGLLGMPRRIYTYEPGRGWDTLNLIVSIGAFIQAIAILVFVWQPHRFLLERSQSRQRSLGCMDARVVHKLSAARVQLRDLPVVASRRPLWDLKHPEDPDSRMSEGTKQ